MLGGISVFFAPGSNLWTRKTKCMRQRAVLSTCEGDSRHELCLPGVDDFHGQAFTLVQVVVDVGVLLFPLLRRTSVDALLLKTREHVQQTNIYPLHVDRCSAA